uniref:ATP synthase F0 subunit 8 n=1 Tax=Pimpla luctuosa TaxID=495389 RepID=A0A3Q8UA02_9HYME|nr:ATP synthase F0 subunit 8 [Pimpla luctuosa]
MPQMAPYNWLYMYMMFNMLLLYLISYMYYNNFNSINLKKINLKKKSFQFKW